jgi:hypothetical protein
MWFYIGVVMIAPHLWIERRILLQRQVRARLVVIRRICIEE